MMLIYAVLFGLGGHSDRKIVQSRVASSDHSFKQAVRHDACVERWLEYGAEFQRACCAGIYEQCALVHP